MKQNSIADFMDEEMMDVEAPSSPRPNAPVEQILIGEDYYIDPPIIVRMNDLSHMNVIYNGEKIAPIHINKSLTRENKRRIERQLKLKTFFNGRGKEVSIEPNMVDDFIYEIEEFYLKYRDKYEAYETALDEWQEEYGELEPDEVQEAYLQRCKPEYDEYIASEVKAEIFEKGFGNYLNEILDNMILGDKKDCIRELIILFSIINGQKGSSCFLESIGSAEGGKSWMQQIIIDNFIPKENIYTMNHLTGAALRDFKGRYFDRMVVFRKDMGDKTGKELNDETFDIIKELITEKEYSTTRRHKEKEGLVQGELKADSICMMYSAIESLTNWDPQLSSRTNTFTPQDAPKKQVSVFQTGIKNPLSPLHDKYEESCAKAKDFQEYIKQCINLDIQVEVGHVHDYIYRMVSTSEREETVRMTTRILDELRSYCILTHYDLIPIRDNVFIPSPEQIQGFVDCTFKETFVNPVQYNFLHNLVHGKSPLYVPSGEELDEFIHESIKETMNSTNEYGLEKLQLGGKLNVDDLVHISEENRFKKYFLDNYSLGRYAYETDIPATFTKKMLERRYRDAKYMKDIMANPEYLYDLKKAGFIDTLDFKTRKGENIYYIVESDVYNSIDTEITKKDIDKFNEYLNEWNIDYQY